MNKEEMKDQDDLTERSPDVQNLNMFMQVRAPCAHVRKERVYTKLGEQEGNLEVYGKLKFNFDESVFSHDKAEMSEARTMVVTSSN